MYFIPKNSISLSYTFFSVITLILSFYYCTGLPLEDTQQLYALKFEREQIPGEPLNPDDFEAGKVYLKSIESGMIQESPDDPSKEIPTKRSGTAGLTWNGAVVPYTMSEQFQPQERAIISSAISEFQPRTCLTFAPRTSEEDYVHIRRGNPGSGCYSMVGRMGGPQTLQVGPDCMRRGSIIHEFLHVAGFIHEHQRNDRDEFVDINYEHIREHLKVQFRLVEKTHNTLTTYDYNSILHYSARADCISPCPPKVKTITPKKDPNAKLGQRKGLSTLDIERANLLYNCTRPSVPSNEASDQVSNQVIGLIPIIRQNLKDFKGCQDFDEKCNSLTASDCKDNSTWINFTCRKTCGYCDSECTDYNVKCEQWSRQNQCQEHPQYMLTYCQKSCGICSARD